MKISVIYLSNRAGCLDILASGLIQQPRDLYELIVIDGYPGRVERGEGEAYLNSLGIPVRAYVPPKQKTFPWSRTGFTNAMNTGLLYSGGTHVVFIHDFVITPEKWLSHWLGAFERYPTNTLIHGVGEEHETIPPDLIDDIKTYSQPINMTYRNKWKPEKFEVGHWGGPIEYFEATNGIDERADFCSHYAYQCVVAQAAMHDYNLVVDESILVQMIDHRKWDTGEWRSPVNSPWRMKGVFSDVPEEPVWSAWSANPFNLKEQRSTISVTFDRPIRVHPRFHLTAPKE